MLKYSKANTKIKALSQVKSLSKFLLGGKKVYSLDLLSGWSCPYANECLSKVHDTPQGRRIKDGPNTLFRCFSASQEALFPAVYNSRKHNFDMLKAAKGVDEKFALLDAALPSNAGVIRIHVAGDFFNQDYFDAWVKMAEKYPNILFYAYTKSLTFWLEYQYVSYNFVLTASYGGKQDSMILQNNLRSTTVVNSTYAARKKKLPIDHDDSHAADPSKANNPFALLIHGTQPAGSKAGKAVRRLKGKGSYGKVKVGK